LLFPEVGEGQGGGEGTGASEEEFVPPHHLSLQTLPGFPLGQGFKLSAKAFPSLFPWLSSPQWGSLIYHSACPLAQPMGSLGKALPITSSCPFGAGCHFSHPPGHHLEIQTDEAEAKRSRNLPKVSKLDPRPPCNAELRRLHSWEAAHVLSCLGTAQLFLSDLPAPLRTEPPGAWLDLLTLLGTPHGNRHQYLLYTICTSPKCTSTHSLRM
jgi:hypothetical protein